MLANLRIITVGFLAILAISYATIAPAMADSFSFGASGAAMAADEDSFIELDSFSWGASGG